MISFITMGSVSSTSKVFYGWIRDLSTISATPKIDWCLGMMIKVLSLGMDTISWNYFLKKNHMFDWKL